MYVFILFYFFLYLDTEKCVALLSFGGLWKHLIKDKVENK